MEEIKRARRLEALQRDEVEKCSSAKKKVSCRCVRRLKRHSAKSKALLKYIKSSSNLKALRHIAN